jgi:hypothetical protein
MALTEAATTTTSPVRPASGAERISDPDAEVPYLSVIVRVTERPVALEDLYREYAPALRALGRPFEFVFAIESRASHLVPPLEQLAKEGEPVRVIEFARSIGEANLLRYAVERASGELILTLPAYHRVQPEAMPELVRRIEAGADLASARRWPRADGLLNRLQSSAFNGILRWLVGHATRDVACGVQAMRRRVLTETPLYGDFFRFLPVLAMREGFRVVEVDARQHADDRSTRLYRPGTYVRRLIDILGLFFLVRFTEKPLRFFGLLGGGLAGLGSVLLVVLFMQRVLGGQPLANRPLLLVGVIALTLGVQAIALGLIGEMIVHLHASRSSRYRVREGDE